MNYRPDIDGLRAIAILFVLFFHGGLSLFPSGFIGVDIFFVISGFLITGILQHSVQKSSFSFTEFYSRRLWRLQPVLICLILCTSLMALLFYLPEDLLQYFKSARKTSLFISNTFFERVTTGYFSPDNNQLPLLHTWSLSIEWQCYLFLPVVIYLLYKVFDQKYIKPAIYLLTLASIVLSLYCSLHYPAKTYYQSLSRIFEFLIGSCVVFSHNRSVYNRYLVETLSAIAFFTLFYIATRTNIYPGFPNCSALALCIATAILLAAGSQNHQSLSTQLLSTKPLVSIGLISYSLYIWHWPVFVFIHYLDIQETYLVLLMAFGIVFVLAYLSWRFIEKPTRRLYTLQFSYSVMGLFILPAMLLHIGDYLMNTHEGFPQRFKEIAWIDKQLKHYAIAQRPLCLQEQDIEVDGNCVLGATSNASKTAFMIGDSYSNHFWGFMDTLGQDAHVSFLAHSTAACLSLPGITQYDWNTKLYKACREQTRRYFSMIKNNHYDFVVIGQNWNGYLGKLIIENPRISAKVHIENALDKALQIIIASGSRPVLIKSIALADNPYGCFYEHIKRQKTYEPERCAYRVKTRDMEWQDTLFARLQNKYSQLIIIDPKAVQCPDGRCKVDINGIPVFRDAGHITDYAAYYFASNYLQQYKNPLA